MLALWAALVFISVSYMCHAPTLEYSEPGALAKPLWAARAFALETTMVGPVAMRVRHPAAVNERITLGRQIWQALQLWSHVCLSACQRLLAASAKQPCAGERWYIHSMQAARQVQIGVEPMPTRKFGVARHAERVTPTAVVSALRCALRRSTACDHSIRVCSCAPLWRCRWCCCTPRALPRRRRMCAQLQLS